MFAHPSYFLVHGKTPLQKGGLCVGQGLRRFARQDLGLCGGRRLTMGRCRSVPSFSSCIPTSAPAPGRCQAPTAERTAEAASGSSSAVSARNIAPRSSGRPLLPGALQTRRHARRARVHGTHHNIRQCPDPLQCAVCAVCTGPLLVPVGTHRI